MPNVLGTMKHPESQASEKIARRQVTSDWSYGKTSASLEKLRNILQLRNVILPVAAVLAQEFKVFIKLFASVLLVKLCKLLEYDRPSFGFLFGVIDAWNWLPMLIVDSYVGELFPALSIDRVLEAL